MSADVREKTLDWRLRDELVESQPVLWAQGMLEEAEKVRTPDARDAILARVGLVLLSRFGMTLDTATMRGPNDLWERRDAGLEGRREEH